MHITKYGAVIIILVLMATVSIFGGYLGYTVNGIDTQGDFAAAMFWINCMTFRVDGMPIYIGAVFWILTAVFGLVIVSLIRGTE